MALLLLVPVTMASPTMALLLLVPVTPAVLAYQHHSFKNKAMKIIEEEQESSDYLEIRNMLQGEDYLGRTLKNREKKQLRKYLERRDAAIESEKASASKAANDPSEDDTSIGRVSA